MITVPQSHFVCKSICDTNTIFDIFRELMEVYPEAKVVLTIRDPESWFISVQGTIYQICDTVLSFPGNIFGRVTGRIHKILMIQRLMRQDQNRTKQGKFCAEI